MDELMFYKKKKKYVLTVKKTYILRNTEFVTIRMVHTLDTNDIIWVTRYKHYF